MLKVKFFNQVAAQAVPEIDMRYSISRIRAVRDNDPRIEEIDFVTYPLDEIGRVLELCEAIKQNHFLKKLNLVGSKISAIGLKLLVEAIQKNYAITHLMISLVELDTPEKMNLLKPLAERFFNPLNKIAEQDEKKELVDLLVYAERNGRASKVRSSVAVASNDICSEQAPQSMSPLP